MTEITIGIDISKETLDVHRHPDNMEHQFANTAHGVRALLKWIGSDVTRIVFEPTGRYHRVLERTLSRAELPMVKVNPRHVRRFAEATGQLAKTDRLDAALLAKMGAVLHLEACSAPSEVIVILRELHVAREALIKDQTAAKNRTKQFSHPLVRRQNTARLKHIKRQLCAIEAEIKALIVGDPALAQELNILKSIPGIAELTAFALIAEMPELGSMNSGQAASLAGLAPISRQSGKWRGKSFIRGGRQTVRRALFMPALVAMRYNPDLKAKYDQLIAMGKPPKVAITAIMRKMIVLANALLKAERPWMPKHA
ncbi:MAG: IS110 family transposase [Rhodospirillaceae bacterium]